MRREKEGYSEDLLGVYMESSVNYLEAATYYPIDDEKHACGLPLHIRQEACQPSNFRLHRVPSYRLQRGV